MDYNGVPSQTCVLKMNFQCCEKCPNKVKRLLQKIDGVYSVTIDAPRGMVTISGKVDPTMLIKMLEKYGRNAELWSFQKDPMHTAQGNGHCNRKKYFEDGGIDQQCCGHNDCHSDYVHHDVHKMKPIRDNGNRPKMTWHHPHFMNQHAMNRNIHHGGHGGGAWGNFSHGPLNGCSNGHLHGAGHEYGAGRPYHQWYGEERTHGNQSFRPVVYDRPPPAYDYFQPQPRPPRPPVANPMTHYLSDDNATGCSVM
ncbi:hypothetical protein L1049_005099 [Liquidambar formosana]|uniref:HMA domain-containing protein n=1 Tax=Liquidambar formosana TaxID=63359 RepID=A0AAP0WXF6_LIQFO